VSLTDELPDGILTHFSAFHQGDVKSPAAVFCRIAVTRGPYEAQQFTHHLVTGYLTTNHPLEWDGWLELSPSDTVNIYLCGDLRGTFNFVPSVILTGRASATKELFSGPVVSS